MSRGHPDFTRYIKYLDIIKSGAETGITITRPSLFRNPSFETGDLTGWSVIKASIDTNVPGYATGNYSCRIEPTGAISQTLPMIKQNKIKLTFSVYAEKATTMRIRTVFSDGTFTTDTYTISAGWTRYSWEPTTDKRIISIGFENIGNIDILIDEIISQITPLDTKSDITNWPTEYPLPDTQVTSLKTVSVDNFPVNYPLPDTQAQGDPLETSGEWTATTAETTLSLNNDFRTLIQFAVSTSTAADVYLEASPDNINWFTLWSKLDVTSYCDWDFIAFPYFRVRIPTTGIDIKIWIRAVKV